MKSSPALEEINTSFHAAYDDESDVAEREAPTLVLLGDELTVCDGKLQTSIAVSAAPFHALKVAAHAPVAVYMLLHPAHGGPVTAATRARLESLRDRMTRASEEDASLSATAKEALSESGRLVASALESGLAPTTSLDAFAKRTGPLLERLTVEATELQLAALDAATAKALALLSQEARGDLHVVVAGDHQARRRSLGMQYFAKRLKGERAADSRLIYGEGVTTVEEALELVGKERVNRQLAVAFFGDAKQLQQDVLGNAAEALLAKTDVSPL